MVMGASEQTDEDDTAANAISEAAALGARLGIALALGTAPNAMPGTAPIAAPGTAPNATSAIAATASSASREGAGGG
jgi:hypothetical protein